MLGADELMAEAKDLGAPYDLVRWVADSTASCPVPNFSAGGIATPADAALMMQLGAEAVFVGSGIFKSSDPAKRAQRHREGDDALSTTRTCSRSVSEDLGDAMVGIEISKMAEKDLMQTRGW